MKRIAANGIELAYDEFGSPAGEAVLLIAGLGTQRIRWTDSFCELLADQGFRVIRFDNRDTGGSTSFKQYPPLDFAELAAALSAGKLPNLPYTLGDMAEDAIGLLDGLGIKRAHLVGRSMGGMIAQLAAASYPDRVLSLVSIMSSSGNPELPPAAPDVMAMMTRPAPNPFEDEAGFLANGAAFAKRIAGTGYPFDEETYRAMIREEARRAYDPGSTGRQIAAIALSGDRRPKLATIRVPALVVHGSDDPMFPPICGEDTARAIPGAEWLLLEGMGHDLPARLEATVAEAVARTARRGRAER
ncbi:alpha/beta hydrolase [Saccharibacillus sp. O23]|uniref:alpha/beta fold hydrolase n=1 Tax=Saccharibacillus sp. O23 TaxID=2009338 RepID=UPI000B4E1244|nr:alpha/beta hydrolase [Saccharibacillus sp. O23]OWR30380.1 alpha/beta hydrolase [Saccharibacillus sp. O23]